MSTQLELGEVLKSDGIERISQTRAKWLDEAKAVLRKIAKTEPEFTSDNLRGCVPPPPHPNCVGAAFNSLAKEGTIIRVGFAKSSVPSRHAAVVSVWKGVE